MIKIEFTCYVCGDSSEIGADDMEEKAIVPVCDDCYKIFLFDKQKLIKSFVKNLTKIYDKYGIPVDTFDRSDIEV